MWQLGIALAAVLVYAAQIYVARRLSAKLGLQWAGAPLFFAFAIFAGVLMSTALGPLVAALVAVTCNLLIGGRLAQAARRMLRVQRLLQQLSGPRAEAALLALDYEVEGLRGGRGGEKPDYEHRARWVLAIASRASQAGYAARALEWTQRLEAGVLGRPVAAALAQHEASFLTTLGDRAGARRVIARVPRPAVAPWEEALCALETLLEAMDGDARAAIDRAGSATRAAPTGPLRLTWQMAHAHGLARMDSADEAKDVLRAVRSESGDAALHRMAAHRGPASRLAEALLAERGAYR